MFLPLAQTILVLTLIICLGLFVFLRNQRSWTNRFFGLLTITIALYTVVNYLSLYPPQGTETQLFWIRMVMFVCSFLGPLLFLLIHTFPKEKIHLRFRYILFLIILAAITAGLSLTDGIFKDLVFQPGSPTPIPVPGIAIPIYLFDFTGLFIISFILLIKKYRVSTGIERTQLKFFLFGIIGTFSLLSLTGFLFVIVLKITSFVYLGPFYFFILLLFVSYAIIKHRFLDIRLVVVRSVIFTILIVIIGILYTIGIIFLVLIGSQQKVVFRIEFERIVLALLIAFSFQYILRLVEKLTNKIFYKGRYESHVLFNNINGIMVSTFNLENLAKRLLKELTEQMKISNGFLILKLKDSHYWINGYGRENYPYFASSQYQQLADETLKNKGQNVLIFEDLAESPVKALLREQEIRILTPLVVKNETIGLFCLGEKASGEIYSTDDLKVIQILVPEVAIAIKNALSIEEIRRFNITLQKEVDKATTELKTTNSQLQELDKLKDEFVSLASHELRTPMTAIRGSLSTILEGYAGQISDSAREFLQAAYNENDRLIRLVNNLLNISRIEAGRLKFEIVKLDIRDVVTEVVKNLEGAATEKQLYLKCDISPDMKPVLADNDMLKEVFINIIGNAVKFTHKGGVTVNVYAHDGKARVSITDSGSGISQDDQNLLFKKFSQAQGNYAKQAGGTGLGLYICKKIIEGMNGKIWLESTIGQGSTFHFSLPLA